MVTTNGDLRTQVIEEYWINQLIGDFTNFELPHDRNENGKREYSITIPTKFLERLQHTAKQSKLGVYILLLAGLSNVMYKYTDSEDVIIGMDSINADSSNIIFAKLPSNFNSKFIEHINSVKQKVKEIMRYQNVSLDTVLEKIRIRNNNEIQGLFNIAFYSKSLQDVDTYSERFDLAIIFDEDNRSFIIRDCNMQYSSSMVHRFIDHWMHFIENALNDPEMIISEIEMMPDSEKQEIIYGINATATEFPKMFTASQLFEQQVNRSPDAIAVTCEGSSLSYLELNKRANQFSGLLMEKGAKPNGLIPLLSERSIDMLISILGVFKAGGAYVPLDPEFPDERIKTIILSSQSRFLLVSKLAKLKYCELIEELENDCILENVIEIDSLWGTPDNECSGMELYSNENRLCVNSPSDMAYVIYTSGTTGTPKGVMIEHVGMINHIYAKIRESCMGPDSIVAQNASHCFDISVWQFLSALLVGGKTVIYKDILIMSPLKFAQKVNEDNITILELVPSYLLKVLELVESGNHQNGFFENIQELYVTGEILQPNLVRKWFELFPTVPMINAYGPTEASDDITHNKMIGLPERNIISIGKPLANFHIYIVNEHMQLNPRGMIGEICVSGIGVGKGYFNDLEKSERFFLMDPFVKSEKRRMYKTGDIGRILEDGSIQYFGRRDQQIKIRGYRIELTEIEQALLNIDGIKETVVILREDELCNKNLCAYFVSDERIESTSIKDRLQQMLPGYMIPTVYHQLSSFPLTSNGKIDRKSLPSPEFEIIKEIILPKTDAEKRMLRLWDEVLKPKHSLSMDEAFYEAGGHSLRAMELAFNIEKEFKVDVPIVKILNNPTIKELCTLVDSVGLTNETVAVNKIVSLSYPASSAQQRLYMLHEMARENLSYNLPGVYQIKGEFYREQFIEALKLLLVRHESLRTSFLIKDQKLLQQVHENIDILSYFKEKHISPELLEQEIQQFIRPFDLIEGPLFRIQLVHCDHELYIFLDMHHIITDGISSNIIIHDFVDIFERRELPTLHVQYKDYTAWQEEFFQSPLYKVQEQYWLEQFKGEVPLLNLSTDYLRPAINNYKGASIEIDLDSELTESLQQIAIANGTTLYTVMLSLYYVLLFKYTSQKDIVVGSPVSGRADRKFKDVVGLFVNTLPLRSQPEAYKTFIQFLSEVRKIVLDSFSNQDYPFEKLAEYSKSRDLGRNPLFDTMFSWQQDNEVENRTVAIEFISLNSISNTAKFDISLLATKHSKGIQCVFEYRTQLFTELTIKNFALHFKNLAYAVIQSPAKQLCEIDMLSFEERSKLIDLPKLSEETDTFVHELFMNQALSNPSQIVAFKDHYAWTYKDLQKKVNLYAKILREKGITRGDIIGLIGNHSFELLANILAILQAGGAYLPIDSSLPADRINDMLMDSNARILLTVSNAIDGLQFNGEVFRLEKERLQGTYVEKLENINQPTDVAYIIYTSGSTGKPKGVMITHGALSNYISWAHQIYVKGRRIKFALYSSLSFDLTVTSIFVPLISGNSIVIYSDQSNELLIRRIFSEQKADVIKLTPAHLELVKDMNFTNYSGTQVLIVGGEELRSELANQIHLNFNGKVEIYNEYGPTEATVGCMVHKYDPEQDSESTVSIGRPIHGTQIYILDQSLNLSPTGVPGEIYIGGKGLSSGYLNQKELTERTFIDSPFFNGQKLYKTGDMAKRNPDGKIQYLGRFDEQVKIRGYRIELQEIENYIKLYEGVKEAIACSRVDKQGNKYLCAYFTVKHQNNEIAGEDIKLYLSGVLPNYMVPSFIIKLNVIPINANGKVDKKHLPSPSNIQIEGVYKGRSSSETERKLLSIWGDLLDINEINVDDNFFEIGGHSLLLLHLHKSMEEIFAESIEMTSIFAYPTIAKMARYLDNYLLLDHHRLIQGMKIHKPYFMIADEQYVATLESNIEGQTYQLVKMVSNKYKIEVFEFLMASFLLTLANIVLEDTVILHTIPKFMNEVQIIKVLLTELEDLDELFNIAKFENVQGIKGQYRLEDIDFRNVRIGYESTAVLFYKPEFLTSSIESTVYGISIGVKEVENTINIIWNYNEKRLNQLRIKQLKQIFISNCERLANKLANLI